MVNRDRRAIKGRCQKLGSGNQLNREVVVGYGRGGRHRHKRLVDPGLFKFDKDVLPVNFSHHRGCLPFVKDISHCDPSTIVYLRSV